MHEKMLTYGLKKGTINELLYIDGVPNGLACDCVCPHCQHTLIARNRGLKKEHHFAHQGGADCPGARISALHILAQNIIAETKQVMLPCYKGQHVMHEAKLKIFDRVALEEICRKEDCRRRPDCVGYDDAKSTNIWIEIYCRHKVDEIKRAEIKNQQQYCIEIDLSDLLDKDYTKEDVRFRLIEDSEYRQWICCPVWDKEDAAQKAKAEADNIERQKELRVKQQEQERLQTIADTWLKHPDSITTKVVIDEIKKKPYANNENGNSCIFEYLVPQNNWIGFIEKLPRNTEGQQVFYTLLHYYYGINLYDPSRSKLWRLDKPMWELLQSPNNSQRETMSLEYMIVVWVLNELQADKHFRNKDSQLGKIFVQNKNIRDYIINLFKRGRARDYFDSEIIRRQIEQELIEKHDGDITLQIFHVCFPIHAEMSEEHGDNSVFISKEDYINSALPQNEKLESEEERNIRQYWQYTKKYFSDAYILKHKNNL